MQKFLTSFFILFTTGCFCCEAQSLWRGIALDSLTGEPLVGVIIQTTERQGVKTGINGEFSVLITFPAQININFTGYSPKRLLLQNIEMAPDTILLNPASYNLNEVVVTAARGEQKLETVVQSVEIIKPELLINTQTNQVNEVMEKLPGVLVQKDQVTIRGISGFSYGAGTRVMMLLDEMPILSADASDVKWNYLPLENLEQIEVIKGASSALYGSSAMEGVIHMRTALPGEKPVTTARAFYGVYDMSAIDSNFWGGGMLAKAGFSLAHRRSFKNFKISSSLYHYRDQSYRVLDDDNLLRGNLFVQYMPAKTDKLVISGSINGMRNEGNDFLFFGDVKTPYIPFNGTTTAFVNSRWHTDLSLKYYPHNQTRHILRGRLFSTLNKNSTAQGSAAKILFTEYQFQQTLFQAVEIKSILTTGINYITSIVNSQLYSDHDNMNLAGYAQLDQQIKRLTLSFGSRFEAFKMDTLPLAYFPVFRGGMNLQVHKGSFLRASVGQGFRYPSIAERFTATASGAVRIFPNQNVEAESGWTAETGFRQILPLKKIKAYVDIAAFWAEYSNMIEYKFGFYPPANFNPFTMNPQDFVGFKAWNFPQTQVKGLEFSTGASKTIGNFKLNFLTGYTYTIPLIDSLRKTDTTDRLKYLRYRRQHLLRGNLELSYKWIGIGVYTIYNSPIKNMDQFFIDLIAGLKPDDYWKTYSEGLITDARLSFTIKQDYQVSLVVKNVLNEQYMEVPGNTNPPRAFLLQINAQL